MNKVTKRRWENRIYNHPDIASNQTPRIVLTIVLPVASLSNTVPHRFEKLFFNTYPAAAIAEAVF